MNRLICLIGIAAALVLAGCGSSEETAANETAAKPKAADEGKVEAKSQQLSINPNYKGK